MVPVDKNIKKKIKKRKDLQKHFLESRELFLFEYYIEHVLEECYQNILYIARNKIKRKKLKEAKLWNQKKTVQLSPEEESLALLLVVDRINYIPQNERSALLAKFFREKNDLFVRSRTREGSLWGVRQKKAPFSI